MKKNVIKRIILGTILTIALPIQAFSAEIGDTVYSTGNVNIHSNPDTDSEIIGGLELNSQCIIVEGPDQYDWMKIQSGDVIGYVGIQYFSNLPLTFGYTVARVNSEVLYVRQYRDEESTILDTLYYGDEVEVTTEYDGSAWVEVVTKEGLYGYVSADYVSLHTYYPEAQMIFDEPVQEENSYYTNEEYSESSEIGNYEVIELSYENYDYSYNYNTPAYEDYTDYDNSNQYEEPSYEEPIDDVVLNDIIDEEPVMLPDNVIDYEIIEDEPMYNFPIGEVDNITQEEYYESVENEDYTSYDGYSGIAATANQYLGNSYVWGGSAPGGFDCSGLAQYSYAQNGITIPRVAADQYYGGTQISVEDAINTPGALIFYHDLGHVAISNGDGTITHASNYDTGVIVSDAYYSTPYGAVVY